MHKYYTAPAVRGKYVALCEGDDYWIDPYKLQKQFDVMEEHTDCTMCVHKHERLESLRATEQGPPTANCTGLHKALADGTPERRAKGS